MTDAKLTDMGGVSRKGSDLLSVICHLSFLMAGPAQQVHILPPGPPGSVSY
jgi:hypothetical protein